MALVVGALAVGGLLVAAISARHPLRVLYDLRRLGRDPEALKECLRAEPGSPAREAMSRFLEDEAGRVRLLDHVLSTLLGGLPSIREWQDLALGPGREVVATFHDDRVGVRLAEVEYLDGVLVNVGVLAAVRIADAPTTALRAWLHQVEGPPLRSAARPWLSLEVDVHAASGTPSLTVRGAEPLRTRP